MKLRLLSVFLLVSCMAVAQSSSGKGVSDNEKKLFVMLAPGGSDTNLEVRSAMRIRLVHMEEGHLVGYRFKDRAFLAQCKSEADADAMMAKLQSWFRGSKVEKLYTSSYINEGFREVTKGTGRKDPTFPLYYETGDNPLDARSYRIEKLDWINSHPMPEDGSLPGDSYPPATKK